MNENLRIALEKLTPEQQAKVLEFVDILSATNLTAQNVMFYINRFTFEASEQFPDLDLQHIVPCFDFDDEELFKPVTDASGQLVTRAPRWFVQLTSRR